MATCYAVVEQCRCVVEESHVEPIPPARRPISHPSPILQAGVDLLIAATAPAIERLDPGDALYGMPLQASYDPARQRRTQAA